MPPSTDPELLKRLEDAAARLPRLTREVFLDHCVQALSYQQMAERTGLTVHEIERHMAQAIYRLAEALDEPKPAWWTRWFR